MKILIVGDQHFRYQLPYATALPDGRRDEWEDVKDTIHKSAEQCDIVVLMGDNFNSKHNHSSVNSEFIEFLQRFGDKDIYIIAGNHERFGNETAIDFIAEMRHPKWHVYTVPTNVMIAPGITADFLPFMTAGVLGATDIPDATQKAVAQLRGGNYLFHHHIVESTEWGSGDSSIVTEIVLPKTIENNYDLVFGGHIHQPSKVTEKVHVVGNIFTNEVGEHEKFIFTLDTDTNTVESIKLPCRGIYKVEVTAHNHFFEELLKIPDASIVKMIVLDRSLQGDAVEGFRKLCERFDAFVLIEQYSKQRKKVRLSEAGGLDLSLDSLLRVYCEQRKLPHADLKAALDLLEA